MIHLIRKLRELGYSQDEANRLYALHISRGTLDILACSVSQKLQENGVK